MRKIAGPQEPRVWHLMQGIEGRWVVLKGHPDVALDVFARKLGQAFEHAILERDLRGMVHALHIGLPASPSAQTSFSFGWPSKTPPNTIRPTTSCTARG